MSMFVRQPLRECAPVQWAGRLRGSSSLHGSRLRTSQGSSPWTLPPSPSPPASPPPSEAHTRMTSLASPQNALEDDPVSYLYVITSRFKDWGGSVLIICFFKSYSTHHWWIIFPLSTWNLPYSVIFMLNLFLNNSDSSFQALRSFTWNINEKVSKYFSTRKILVSEFCLRKSLEEFPQNILESIKFKKYLVCSKMSTVTVNHINMCNWHFAVVAGWSGAKLNCFRYNQVVLCPVGSEPFKGAPDKSEVINEDRTKKQLSSATQIYLHFWEFFLISVFLWNTD